MKLDPLKSYRIVNEIVVNRECFTTVEESHDFRLNYTCDKGLSGKFYYTKFVMFEIEYIETMIMLSIK